MSSIGNQASATAPGIRDRYASFLALVLIGYAFFGKGFAYIGAPPIYIAEITLLLGVFALLGSGYIFATLVSLPAILLVVLIGWATARTLPFIADHGFDALRDSVVIMYGLYAFVVAGLILEKPSRIGGVLSGMSVAATIFVPWSLVAVPLIFLEGTAATLPSTPGSDIPIIFLKPGDAAVFLSATTLMLVLGFRRVTFARILFTIAAFLFCSSLNRGGLLAFALPVMAVVVIQGHSRVLLVVALVAVAMFALAHVLDLKIDLLYRSISVRQVVDNVASIFMYTDEDLSGGSTKTWRLDWWEAIYNYTIRGEHFWTGKGFGVNLAESDGFIGAERLLRNPHSAPMTILARTGVPGVVIWGLVLCAWGALLLRGLLVARLAGHYATGRLFLFVLAFAAAILINASFDVALEGPMQGIWFWCLFGFGLGLAMAYRAAPQLVDNQSMAAIGRR